MNPYLEQAMETAVRSQMGQEWGTVRTAESIQQHGLDTLSTYAKQYSDNWRYFKGAVRSTAFTQLSATEALEKAMEKQKISEDSRRFLRQKYLPEWLTEEIDIAGLEKEADALGIKEEGIDVKKRLGFGEVKKAVTVFELLKSMRGRTDDPDNYLILAGAFTQQMKASNAPQRDIYNLGDRVSDLSFVNRKELEFEFSKFTPPVFGASVSQKPERAKVKNRMLEYLDVFLDFGKQTLAAIENPNDKRHDAAMAVFNKSAVLSHKFRDNAIQRFLDDQNFYGISAVSFMREMYRNSEDTGQNWYRQFADELLGFFRDPRYAETKDYFRDEYVAALDSVKFPGDEVSDETRADFGEILRLDAEASALPSDRPNSTYFFSMPAERLAAWGNDPSVSGLTVYKVSRTAPDLPGGDRWIFKIDFVSPSDNSIKSEPFMVSLVDKSAYVIFDAIDGVLPKDKTFIVKMFKLLEATLREAAEHAKTVKETGAIATGKADTVKIASSKAKGAEKQKRKETKREKRIEVSSVQDLQEEMNEEMIESEIPFQVAEIPWDRVNVNSRANWEKALARYADELRIMKPVKQLRRAKMGKYGELRDGDYRMIFKNIDGTMHFIAAMKRGDLNSWIDEYIRKNKAKQERF